jgi:hypothetical protein
VNKVSLTSSSDRLGYVAPFELRKELDQSGQALESSRQKLVEDCVYLGLERGDGFEEPKMLPQDLEGKEAGAAHHEIEDITSSLHSPAIQKSDAGFDVEILRVKHETIHVERHGANPG